jgi:hypothetical protein
MMKNIKKMALEAYVLHFMMWDELSKRSFYSIQMQDENIISKHRTMAMRRLLNLPKYRTMAVRLHKANNCEFCNFANYLSNVFNDHDKSFKCEYCPSKAKRDGGCLGGLYIRWNICKNITDKARIAAQIRDVELKDWFKVLIK